MEILNEQTGIKKEKNSMTPTLPPPLPNLIVTPVRLEVSDVQSIPSVPPRPNHSHFPAFCEVTEKGKVVLNDTLYIDYLEEAGFRIVKHGDALSLVRIQGNIISKETPEDIKRFVLNQVTSYESQEVKNYLIRNRRFFTSDYLNALKQEEPVVIRDVKDKAYFFYENGVVEVTARAISQPVPYEEFGKLVWSHNIQKRKFSADVNELCAQSVFLKFIQRLTNNNSERLVYMSSLLGYALHNYRTTANTKAIIFNDETVTEQPEGGSGKSLLAIALGYMRTLVKNDGKTFSPKKSFEWSDIDEGTDIVLLDDTSKGFPFEDLFSAITLGFKVEKKGVDKYHLPIEKSPILIITTNSLIGGYGGSFKRRQYSIDINQYFNHNNTPIDEYGHTFFSDWDYEEWARFDALMLCFVQHYLANGVMECPEQEREKKEAIRATSTSFYEWFVEVKDDLINYNNTNTAKGRYIEDTGQRGPQLSAKTFLRYVKSCCEILGYECITLRTSRERGFQIKQKVLT
jgi:hypothetical protein